AGTGSGLGPVIGGTFSDASLLASEELRSRTGLLGALGMWNATSHRTATGDLRQQSAPAEAFDSWTLTSPVVVEWSRLQEDGADADALMAMRKLNYDVREVPKLLQAVNRIADADPRVRLSFFAEKKRLDERLAWLRGRISTASADVGMGTDWTGDFARAMAEVNRDTGILAFRSDLLEMARENLASARNVLSGDPAVHYYYGRTLQALAQDSSQRREAAAELLQAVQHDSYGQFNDAQLHWAVLLLDSPTRDDTAIREALQSYVEKYVAAHRSEDRSKWLPPDIGWIRNYMTASGTQGWVPKLPDGRPMTFSEASPSNPK
ncbi:MAG TPA: hypothetical protein VN893_08880, partial [Bryobacteraceae bacterium]|nr:hypothetical protein [Bryobacteraceae bacterium]